MSTSVLHSVAKATAMEAIVCILPLVYCQPSSVPGVWSAMPVYPTPHHWVLRNALSIFNLVFNAIWVSFRNKCLIPSFHHKIPCDVFFFYNEDLDSFILPISFHALFSSWTNFPSSNIGFSCGFFYDLAIFFLEMLSCSHNTKILPLWLIW